MTTNRRTWLRQGSLALVGLTILSNRLLAVPVTHYTPAFPPDELIRLSSNENPYGPSPLARQAMTAAVTSSNRYPWQVTNKLLEEIGTRYGLTAAHVLIGAGSSEMLGLVTQYAALQPGHAVAADPTFRIWWKAAEKQGLSIVKVPLTNDKKHDLSTMLAKVNTQTRLVYLCNPNNPTGTVLDSNTLKTFIETVSKQTLVLLDEAYIEYTNEPTLAAMVATNKNIVVVKTFSKIYGMAGARIGYALGHPDTIAALESLQPWGNAGVSAVSLAGALASLQDKDFINMSLEKNTAARAFVYDTFAALKIPYIPSFTNFVYYSAQGFSGDLAASLKDNHIQGNRITEESGKWTRITIGTMEEMKVYSNVLKKIWK